MQISNLYIPYGLAGPCMVGCDCVACRPGDTIREMNIIRHLFAKHPFTQILLLGLLAFGVLIKPVLFSMGEMHEIQHDPMAAISHMDLGAEHDENNQSPDHKGSAGALALHTLIHFAHNCDQPTCTETAFFASFGAALSLTLLPTLADSPRKSAMPASLFRPPISI